MRGALAAMISPVTGEQPRMWGAGIVGFGRYHYRYDSGREGDAPLVGFAARKGDISLYVVDGFEGRESPHGEAGPTPGRQGLPLPAQPGAVDMDAFEQLVAGSVARMRERYPDCTMG